MIYRASEDTEKIPLDPAALEMLAEIDQQERALAVARQAILNYFARQNKLGEGWELAPDRRELVRVSRNGHQEDPC
jgi:hypothetical protein